MDQRHAVGFMILFSLCFSQGGSPAYGAPAGTLEMTVKGVTVDPYGNTPIVVLEDAEGHQAFPIWIGVAEAQAIARALEGIPAPRPMTHVLLQNILNDLQVEVTHITIHALQSNTFYASIVLRQSGKQITIDARPSDAIALALGVKAPIFVSRDVLGSVHTVTLSEPSSAEHPARKFGMHLQSLDADLASAFHLSSAEGVLVAFVDSGSQAESQGMRRGDVITDADGRHIQTLRDLLELLENKKTDQEVVLQVVRDQSTRATIRLPLAAAE